MSKFTDHLPKIAVIAFVVGGVAVLSTKFNGSTAKTGSGTVSVSVPKDLSPTAQKGAKLFADTCASCHGENGSGSDKGPPLIHDIYNPGHHGDDSFYRAVRSGVQQHHWPYGNMPAQAKINDQMVSDIVAYVREVQRANGIYYREHRM